MVVFPYPLLDLHYSNNRNTYHYCIVSTVLHMSYLSPDVMIDLLQLSHSPPGHLELSRRVYRKGGWGHYCKHTFFVYSVYTYSSGEASYLPLLLLSQ